MYCPRCGRQPIADELRFCSYCGFKLGVVKASLSDSDDAQTPAGSSEVRTVPRLPRQRDINIGVILMFADAVFVSFMAGVTGPGIGRQVGAVVLAIMYTLIVLFSRPLTKAILHLLSWDQSPDANFSASWRGMVFGATSMFMSTIVLAISFAPAAWTHAHTTILHRSNPEFPITCCSRSLPHARASILSHRRVNGSAFTTGGRFYSNVSSWPCLH